MTEEQARTLARTDHCADICRLTNARPIRVIVDVGANIGETVGRYVRAFPEALVYACEPVWQTFLTLARKVGSHRRVHCLHTALGSTVGNVTLHHQRYSGLNSMFGPINVPDPLCQTVEEVPVTTLDQLVMDHELSHIDLLKLDTEHFDLEVLRGGMRTLGENQISYIYCEVAFDPADQRHSLYDEVASLVSGQGFQVVGFYEQFHHPETRDFEFCNALFAHR